MSCKELFSFLIDSKSLYEKFEKQVKTSKTKVIQTNANTLKQIVLALAGYLAINEWGWVGCEELFIQNISVSHWLKAHA